ncbi:MAG TPA: DUF934 domain-containing protein [Nevskiaceae bacterium]|nr:DUF934 domain-containing protein [Nevskiaceae bacterium]
MSKIIRHQRIVDDDWIAIADDAEIPTSGRAIFSWKRWQEVRDALKTGDVVAGVRIPNTLDLATAWDQLKDRPLIAIEFPAFGDGRAFSQARLLRERYGFKGEIRAVGDVVRDQIFFMHRTGIDTMVPRADQDLAVCLTAFRDFTVPYQGSADQPISVFQRRRV